MTAPTNWYPAPNPGGNDRKAVRYALAAWLTAQRIPALMNVYQSVPMTYRWDLYPGDSAGRFAALVAIRIPSDSEARAAKTGPASYGGKMITYACELQVLHRSFFLDDADDQPDSEDDYDRMINALKDSLHGPGRDLGRPDLYLTLGEWPQQGSIRHRAMDPVLVSSGTVERMGIISFNIEQYTVDHPGLEA